MIDPIVLCTSLSKSRGLKVLDLRQTNVGVGIIFDNSVKIVFIEGKGSYQGTQLTKDPKITKLEGKHEDSLMDAVETLIDVIEDCDYFNDCDVYINKFK